MSELAFNINGEAFDVPATATGWRVRRMRQGRGAPEVVYGRDGVPLIVPIEASLDDLRDFVGTPGRYRLDAVDDRGHTVEKLPASYVVVPARDVDVQSAVKDVRSVDGSAASVMAEAMRLNTELAKAVVDRFPEMMTAAAELLRAADGAGLPSRAPRATDGDESDEDESAPQAPHGIDVNAIIGNVVTGVANGFLSGGTKLDLGSVLDWRKAKPDAKQIAPADAASNKATPTVTASKKKDAEPTNDDAHKLPPLDPQTMAHFIAIQSALKPEEAALAREVASNLGAAELRAWFDELSKLSVPQAVQKIRVLIAGNTEAVS